MVLEKHGSTCWLLFMRILLLSTVGFKIPMVRVDALDSFKTATLYNGIENRISVETH